MATAYSLRAFSLTFDPPPPPCVSELSEARVRRPVRRARRQRWPARRPPHTCVVHVLLVINRSARARRLGVETGCARECNRRDRAAIFLFGGGNRENLVVEP